MLICILIVDLLLNIVLNVMLIKLESNCWTILIILCVSEKLQMNLKNFIQKWKNAKMKLNKKIPLSKIWKGLNIIELLDILFTAKKWGIFFKNK